MLLLMYRYPRRTIFYNQHLVLLLQLARAFGAVLEVGSLKGGLQANILISCYQNL